MHPEKILTDRIAISLPPPGPEVPARISSDRNAVIIPAEVPAPVGSIVTFDGMRRIVVGRRTVGFVGAQILAQLLLEQPTREFLQVDGYRSRRAEQHTLDCLNYSDSIAERQGWYCIVECLDRRLIWYNIRHLWWGDV